MPDYTGIIETGVMKTLGFTTDNVEAEPIDYGSLPPVTEGEIEYLKNTIHESRCKRPGADTLRVVNLQSVLGQWAPRLVAEIERLRAAQGKQDAGS